MNFYKAFLIASVYYALFTGLTATPSTSEINGSVFVVSASGFINKIPLAKIYILNLKEVNALLGTNIKAVKGLIAQADKERLDYANQKMTKYNAKLSSLNNQIKELQAKLDDMNKDIEALSKLFADAESQNVQSDNLKSNVLSDLYQSRQKNIESRDLNANKINSLIDVQNNLINNPPASYHKEHYDETFAKLEMSVVPSSIKPVTETDADGNFTVKLEKDSAYIIIKPIDNNISLSLLYTWFLKISELKLNNNKILFTNENYLLQDNPAQAFRIILQDDVLKCVLN